jgi:hypothetical protein
MQLPGTYEHRRMPINYEKDTKKREMSSTHSNSGVANELLETNKSICEVSVSICLTMALDEDAVDDDDDEEDCEVVLLHSFAKSINGLGIGLWMGSIEEDGAESSAASWPRNEALGSFRMADMY